MVDIVSREKRSQMMSGIKNKDSRPELLIRKALFSQGFRFRLHSKVLPGTPDIVLPKYHAVILVNGCFWHGHDCHLFKWPSSRQEFWKNKIQGNQERDRVVLEKLHGQGWRTLVVWECALKGKHKFFSEELISEIVDWLRNGNMLMELRGQHDR